jgi:hypothetical protein
LRFTSEDRQPQLVAKLEPMRERAVAKYVMAEEDYQRRNRRGGAA